MCLYSTYWAEWEKKNLAPYAIKSRDDEFIKRKYEKEISGEVLDPFGKRSRYRTAFQIDKDRILNSTAFRRLEYKTQMFVSHEGDHYRTRLTHTLEVADIARYIARSMRLNEDLVEAIALGHDLGHTPFGHAGEDALNEIMKKDEIMKKEHEHFHHNIHGIKIVDHIERGYDWDRSEEKENFGMNLTHAVREGILKHTNRGLDEEKKWVSNWEGFGDLDFAKPCHLEGQVVALSDEIAQRIHDLEDGLRSTLLRMPELMQFIGESINDNVNGVDVITGEDIKNVVKIWTKKAEKGINEGDVDKLRNIIEKCKKGELATLLLLDKKLSKIETLLQHNDLEIINSELSEEDIWDISRLVKYKQLYKQIKLKDSRLGNILAFIRGIYLGNAIENSYYNCCTILKGKDNLNEELLTEFNFKRIREEKRRCEIIIGKMGDRRAEFKLFKDEREEYELETELYDITWVNKANNVEETQIVKIKLIGKDKESKEKISRSMEFPIEQVKINVIRKDLISFSQELCTFDEKLKDFVERYLYRHPTVARMNARGKYFIQNLYYRFLDDPLQLHEGVWERFEQGIISKQGMRSPSDFDWETIKLIKDSPEFRRLICEHLSGMTDRYLRKEHETLFGSGSILP